MFAEEASSEASEAGVASEGAVGGVAPAKTPKGRKANPLSDVKYGKAEEQELAKPEEEIPQITNEGATEETFEDLIGKNGKYKAEFDAKVQAILNDRFKSQKNSNDTLAKLTPVIELLGSKYGIDAKNLDKLDVDKFVETITQDDSYYEDEALEKGIPVETLKELKAMERENDMMRKALEERTQREQNDRAFAEIVRQSEALKTIYPSFDLNYEMANPEFARLVKNGVPIQTVFEVIHRSELMPQAMRMVAEETERRVAANVQANRNRPSENGLNNTSPSLTKSDPRNLTKEDRMEIRRRVSMGEKIRW